jgi:hypothetical protein
MNVRLSLHNVLMIGAIAVLFILALRAASKTGVRNIPVIGQVVATGAGA